jgi:hypothetical protein
MTALLRVHCSRLSWEIYSSYMACQRVLRGRSTFLGALSVTSEFRGEFRAYYVIIPLE